MSDVEAFLAHHGVRGMKWGHRKSKAPSVSRKRLSAKELSTGYSKGQYEYDRQRFGTKGANRINEHVSKGGDLKEGRVTEHQAKVKRQKIVGAAVLTAYLAASFGPAIMDASARSLNTAVLNKRASNAEKFAAQRAAQRMSDIRGIANYSTVHLNYNPSTGVWG